jgi:hypothetical protein
VTTHQHHHLTPRKVVRWYPLTVAWFTLAVWVTFVVLVVEEL